MTLHLFAKLFEMTCPVIPIAQPRQRSAMIAGHIRNYTPSTHPVNVFKSVLQAEAGKLIKTPLLGPLAISVSVYLPRPKSLMKKSSPAGPIPHFGRPDLDNLLKSTQDALKGIVWQDDSQIYVYTNTGKWYCEKDGQPRVCIVVAADCASQEASA